MGVISAETWNKPKGTISADRMYFGRNCPIGRNNPSGRKTVFRPKDYISAEILYFGRKTTFRPKKCIHLLTLTVLYTRPELKTIPRSSLLPSFFSVLTQVTCLCMITTNSDPDSTWTCSRSGLMRASKMSSKYARKSSFRPKVLHSAERSSFGRN